MTTPIVGDQDPSRTARPAYPTMRAMSVHAAVVDRGGWSRRTHRSLFALSGLCVALSCLVFFAGDTYYWVERILPPAFWFLFVATLIQMASSLDEQRGAPIWGLRGLVVTLGLLVAFGGYTVWSANTKYVSSVRSPDGRFTAVVTEGAAVIDPIWNVTVHQNAGLLARKWDAGCVNGDDPANTFASLMWVSDTTLEVRTESGQGVRASVNAAGRPLNRVATHDEICP